MDTNTRDNIRLTYSIDIEKSVNIMTCKNEFDMYYVPVNQKCDIAIKVSNKNKVDITCSEMCFKLVLGEGENALVKDIGSFRQIDTGSNSKQWGIERQNSNCEFMVRPTEQETWKIEPGESVTFSLLGINISPSVGSTDIVIQDSTSYHGNLPIIKYHDKAIFNLRTEQSPVIKSGESALLRWESQPGAEFTVKWEGNMDGVDVQGDEKNKSAFSFKTPNLYRSSTFYIKKKEGSAGTRDGKLSDYYPVTVVGGAISINNFVARNKKGEVCTSFKNGETIKLFWEGGNEKSQIIGIDKSSYTISGNTAVIDKGLQNTTTVVLMTESEGTITYQSLTLCIENLDVTLKSLTVEDGVNIGKNLTVGGETKLNNGLYVEKDSRIMGTLHCDLVSPD